MFNTKIKFIKYLIIPVLALIVGLLLLVIGVLWAGHSIIILPAGEYALQGQNFASISHVSLESLPVETQIRKIFGEDSKIALAVSQAENGTRQCDREGKTKDHGIFQINEVHLKRWSIEQLKDCTQNILIAHQLFHEQGWGIWQVYKNQSYKRFLN